LSQPFFTRNRSCIPSDTGDRARRVMTAGNPRQPIPHDEDPMMALRHLVIALSCLVAASTSWAQLRTEVVASGLSAPVAFVQDPVLPNVQFIVEQGGRIRVLRDGGILPQDFLDLRGQISSGGERGLLGLAFAPDYAISRRFYVNFTNPAGHTVIARFLRSAADPVRSDPSSRLDLLWPDGNRFITQPFANHNGGDLHFGSDGYLYIGMGDGGSGNDPLHNAQNPATLLGKMLRLDVSVGDSDPEGYDAPPDNPFRGASTTADLIWAFGLRNPFRFTVDRIEHGGTGALVIGDVGQNGWEEVNYEPFARGGRNYGWRNREGAHDNVTSVPPAFGPLVDPIIEYSHAVGNVITGGGVYRGAALGASFTGRYFYADFGARRLWSASLTVNPSTGEATAGDIREHTAELGGDAVGNISAFGIDVDREMYLVSYVSGQVLRVLSTAGAPAGGCTTPDPFAAIGGGVCIGDGWVPRDHPLAGGGSPPPSGPPPAGGGPAPPPSTCTAPMPGSDWVCVGGGWLPPGHPLAGGATPPPAVEPPPVGGEPATPPPSTCTSPMPGSDWVCMNGGWLPPGHPLATTPPAPPAPAPGAPPATACATPDPFVAIGGGVCVNGGWVPRGHPLASGGS
jgi:glucose/arabinose dehydrogenase